MLLLYRSLTKSPAWDRLGKEMGGQITHRTNDLVNAMGLRAERENIDGMTMVLKSEFDKGVRAGILFVMGFPRARIQALETSVGELRHMIADMNGEDADG